MHKKCYLCDETKPLETGFSKNKQRKDGYDNRCKTCRSKVETERMKNLSEAQKEAYRANWRKRNHRNKYNKYGLDENSYNDLAKDQGFKCLICDELCDKLVVDHDHVSGRVRGLLCTNCNVGLGHFRDSVITLSKAIDYINKHNGE